MKTLKYFLIFSLLSFGLNAWAGDAPAPTPRPPQDNDAKFRKEAQSKKVDQAETDVKDEAKKEGEVIGNELLDTARKESDAAKGDSDLDQLESKIDGITNLVALNQFVSQLKESSQVCTSFVEEGVTCCTSPDKCGGESSALQRAANTAGQVGQISEQATSAVGGGAEGEEGGGAGAASQCLSALPGLASGLASSEGVSQACGKIRDGDGSVQGCSNMCGRFQELASKAGGKASGLIKEPSEITIAKTIEKEASEIAKEMKSQKSTCDSSLSSGEAAAGQQSAANSGGIGELFQCLQSLLNGDETQDEEEEEEQKTAVNCSNPAEAAENTGICAGAGAADGLDSALSRNSLALERADGGEDNPELEQERDRNVANTGSNNALGGPSQPGGRGFGGGLGGGQGGASQKAGGRRGRRGKPKGLVTGYKNVKGGGSSGNGRRGRGFAFKPYGGKAKKKKEDKNKKVLAALAALKNAKINPSIAGSIFERSTKAFNNPKFRRGLFDAPKNETLWMKKR